MTCLLNPNCSKLGRFVKIQVTTPPKTNMDTQNPKIVINQRRYIVETIIFGIYVPFRGGHMYLPRKIFLSFQKLLHLVVSFKDPRIKTATFNKTVPGTSSKSTKFRVRLDDVNRASTPCGRMFSNMTKMSVDQPGARYQSYIPGTQMALDLVAKGLVLRGLASKIEVIWVLGIYIYIHRYIYIYIYIHISILVTSFLGIRSIPSDIMGQLCNEPLDSIRILPATHKTPRSTLKQGQWWII